jgi:hypothetical protein
MQRQDNALNKKTSTHMSGYCPIRKISVERGGARVKRFNVSEDISSELLNLTEYRQSGTPGDFTGASFWYFLREKVHMALGAQPRIGFILSPGFGMESQYDYYSNKTPIAFRKQETSPNPLHAIPQNRIILTLGSPESINGTA